MDSSLDLVEFLTLRQYFLLKTRYIVDINSDDERIISSLKSGDKSAFSEIYKFYYAPLRGFLVQYVNLKDAEDIIQDTMMWIWDNCESINPKMSFKSLVFTISKNQALNKLSHYEVKTRIHLELYEKYKEQFDDPDFYIGGELMAKFNEALDQLPKEYAETFRMSRFEGLTYAEIAEKLNVSPKTVSYRITQSLKILRHELKDYLPLLIFLMREW